MSDSAVAGAAIDRRMVENLLGHPEFLKIMTELSQTQTDKQKPVTKSTKVRINDLVENADNRNGFYDKHPIPNIVKDYIRCAEGVEDNKAADKVVLEYIKRVSTYKRQLHKQGQRYPKPEPQVVEDSKSFKEFIWVSIIYSIL